MASTLITLAGGGLGGSILTLVLGIVKSRGDLAIKTAEIKDLKSQRSETELAGRRAAYSRLTERLDWLESVHRHGAGIMSRYNNDVCNELREAVADVIAHGTPRATGAAQRLRNWLMAAVRENPTDRVELDDEWSAARAELESAISADRLP